MRRPWHGAMPVTLMLPPSLERRPRVRQRRARRLAIGALIALGVALLAAGFWLPAKAELAQHLLHRASARTADGATVIAGHRDPHFRALQTLAIGDELVLERPDGAVLRYEVAALDVVDSARAELRLDTDENIVVLVTCWPFDAAPVGGSWRYVVTARRRF